MLLRVRTRAQMFRIEVDYELDRIRDVREKIATKMKTNIDNIIISNCRNYNKLLKNSIKLSSLTLENGHIFYADTIIKQEITPKPQKLSQIKKRWTFTELCDYEKRNTHDITKHTQIKKITINKTLINIFFNTVKRHGINNQRYGILLGHIKDEHAFVETIFIPEQNCTEHSSTIDKERHKYYKNSYKIITQKLDLQVLGNIIYFTNKDWRNTKYITKLLDDTYKLYLIANKNEKDVSVDAWTIDTTLKELYNKNIIYKNKTDNHKLQIMNSHTLSIKKHSIKNSIDIDLLFLPVPIIHKIGKYYNHDLTFMEHWRYKRIYNFKNFRKYMLENCPNKKVINEFIYDITFLIYVSQWFNKNDFILLLQNIKNDKISKGFHSILCGICDIK